jgi:hypothetical protein
MTLFRRFLPSLVPLVAFSTFAAPVFAASPAGIDPLADGFRHPPEAARPRTWWHWTRSNVSLEGITKDLEWMKRTGLGGFQLADVNAGGGQNVDPKTAFGTPEWYAAVRHAASEADRLGLEMAIFSSPGWSETGGHWVKPEEAMKKLVWSEQRVEGGRRFVGQLPAPPSVNGQIRNTRSGYYAAGGNVDPTHYADSAVVAYRTPAGERTPVIPVPTITSHAGPVDAAALLDDDLATLLTLPAPGDGAPAWIQYTYAESVTVRAVTLGGRGGSANGIPVGRVLASDDGVTFLPLLTLPGAQLYRQGMVRTYAFAPTTARVFRLELTGAPMGPAQTMSQATTAPAPQYVLSEAIFHAGARVHRWEEKAGFSFLFEYNTVPTPDVSAEATVTADDVIDLTAAMAPDGTLTWDAPPGDWTVLRLGYSLTGAKNRPATPAGSGFEADKLNRTHMESYIRGYFDPIQQALGPLFGKSLRYVMMDSWEAGTNNWTDNMADEFRRRRGYDPTPYLPALTGRIVNDARTSDRFLWDFRRTLADLWADHHYGTMADRLRERGLGIYAEAAGVSLEMPEDTLLNKSKVEIPMGEFWVRDLHPRLMYLQDVRGAASASHVYGKPLVAAEAFTGGGYESPYTLKKVADYWFAQGVNRMVFHTSAHQPLDTAPGNTMVGTHLHRNITWAEQAAPFVTYLARVSHLLQQGRFVADLVYLLDEGAPSTPPIWAAGTQPTPPEGFDYDFINADVLLNRLAVDPDGRLTVPDGPAYRVLVLPETDQMRPELLRKLRDLVVGGAIVVGPKPRRSPSLMGQPAADHEVATLAEEIWGDLDGESRTLRRHGRGTVIWGWPLERVMTMQGIPKDFEYARGLDSEVAWLHRRTDDADLFYVANLTDHAQRFEARFRVEGRRAEVWRTLDGRIEPVAAVADQGRARVTLDLSERESVFVVFRGSAEEGPTPVPRPAPAALATLEGPWQVTFPPDRGAPPSVTLAPLTSWTESPDDGIKYFSGTAIYAKSLDVPGAWRADGARLLLDLGRVGDLAEVIVNGRAAGLVWAAPFRIDVTDLLVAGANRLEIRVTNQWTNRIAGDRAAPEGRKVLNLPAPAGPGFGGGRTLRLPASGLLGPVTLLRQP